MSIKAAQRIIRRRANELGLTVSVQSPGDGKTRYVFVRDSTDISRVLLGYGQADLWLSGYETGVEHMRQEHCA